MGTTLELLTIKQASKWASEFLGKDVTLSSISYLIQYGRLKRAVNNGNLLINKDDLVKYYNRILVREKLTGYTD